jgi:hypothetical protein
MSVSLKRYACTPENWLEVGVIGLMGFILWIPDNLLSDPCDVKRHAAAVTIVASWWVQTAALKSTINRGENPFHQLQRSALKFTQKAELASCEITYIKGVFYFRFRICRG